MCPSLIKNSGNLRSHSNYNCPTSDIRKNPPRHTAFPLWLSIGNNVEIAKCYNVVVNRILSHFEGTSLNDVEKILSHEYLFPIEVVHAFTKFIISTPTLGIEFDEKDSNTRLTLIF
jgi:hypothetical protein